MKTLNIVKIELMDTLPLIDVEVIETIKITDILPLIDVVEIETIEL